MNIGVVYPQIEYSSDPSAIRDYAQMAEGLGFSHILAYDHVLGANPQRPEGWKGPYTYQNPFQEPLTMFSFMAGLTEKINFTTGVVILPQRQTALFAKQAATLDVLSSGRLRVGVGTGWNQVEYTALNEDFHNRGLRSEEQVEVLRLLWTQPLVTFQGRWHTILDAGINPLPLQQPIPIWFGGHAEAVLQRAARLGNGWMPNYRRPAEAQPSIERLSAYVEQAGRPAGALGLEARLHYETGSPGSWIERFQEWQAAGASHITFNTMDSGFTTPQEHLAAIRAFAQAVGLSG